MRASDAFPSDYLKASDLQDRAVTVTIANVEMVELGKDRDKETKLLITFVGKQKGFICNKTNMRTITKLMGTDETDEWIGKRITIEPREVEFGSETVMAIRVSLKAPPAPSHGMMGKPVKRPAPSPVAEPADQDGGGVESSEEEPGF